MAPSFPVCGTGTPPVGDTTDVARHAEPAFHHLIHSWTRRRPPAPSRSVPPSRAPSTPARTPQRLSNLGLTAGSGCRPLRLSGPPRSPGPEFVRTPPSADSHHRFHHLSL